MGSERRGLMGYVQDHGVPVSIPIPNWNPKKEFAELTIDGLHEGQIVSYSWRIRVRD